MPVLRVLHELEHAANRITVPMSWLRENLISFVTNFHAISIHVSRLQYGQTFEHRINFRPLAESTLVRTAP